MILTDRLEIRGSQDPLFGLCNLLQWLTELRETVHLLYTSLLQKDTTQKPDQRDAWGKHEGMGPELPCPLQTLHLRPHIYEYSSLRGL